jgi:hypothetical protein
MMDRGHFYSDGAEKSNGAKKIRLFGFNVRTFPLSKVFLSGIILASVVERSRNLND